MNKASFKFASSNSRLDVTLSGVFTIEDSKRYEIGVLDASRAFSGKWVMVADVTQLLPSTLEAVEYVQDVTRKLYENGCQAIITITNDKDAVVNYQVKKAAGDDLVHFTHNMEEANAIVSNIEL